MTSITTEQLYEHYSKDFRGRVNSVFTEDTDSGLSDRLRANVSRFAAYKAEYVSGALQRALNDESIPAAERTKFAKAVLNTFSRYQDAERSTATARARTAKQFEEFMDPDNVRLFPNLKWLPSRSADPRASHTVFYNHIWPKDDPFWNTNAPGTEWNCKCDIEETSEPATDNSAVPPTEVPLGLEGNPAKTGEIFTDNASYIRTANKTRHNAVSNFARHHTIKEGKRLYDVKVPQTDEKGAAIDVEFNSNSISHFANDMLHDRKMWLKKELTPKLDEVVGKAKLVAFEPNTKLADKPTHQYYLYYETKLADGTPLYISVYQNRVDGKYKFYAVSKTLRKTATRV